MPSQPHVKIALRKCVRELNFLAVKYGVPYIPHTSSDADVKSLRRKLLLKLHQDKTRAPAGSPTNPDYQKLSDVWKAYQDARSAPPDADAPGAANGGNPAPGAATFRMRGRAFLAARIIAKGGQHINEGSKRTGER